MIYPGHILLRNPDHGDELDLSPETVRRWLSSELKERDYSSLAAPLYDICRQLEKSTTYVDRLRWYAMEFIYLRDGEFSDMGFDDLLPMLCEIFCVGNLEEEGE